MERRPTFITNFEVTADGRVFGCGKERKIIRRQTYGKKGGKSCCVNVVIEGRHTTISVAVMRRKQTEVKHRFLILAEKKQGRRKNRRLTAAKMVASAWKFYNPDTDFIIYKNLQNQRNIINKLKEHNNE